MQRERNKPTIPATHLLHRLWLSKQHSPAGPGVAGAVHPTLNKIKSKTSSTCILAGSSDTNLCFLWDYSQLSAGLCSSALVGGMKCHPQFMIMDNGSPAVP